MCSSWYNNWRTRQHARYNNENKITKNKNHRSVALLHPGTNDTVIEQSLELTMLNPVALKWWVVNTTPHSL